MTKTVSGFMDFVTTVGNTVMVFTPAGLEAEYSESQNSRTRNPTGSLPQSVPIRNDARCPLGAFLVFFVQKCLI